MFKLVNLCGQEEVMNELCPGLFVPISLFSAQSAGSGGRYFIGFCSKVRMCVRACYNFLCLKTSHSLLFIED